MSAELPFNRTLILKRRIPSQNQFHYAHWRKYATERDAWFILLRTTLIPRAHPPDYPVRIRLHSFRTRLLDYANLVGGAKPIPDALIKLGYLKDDHPRWFHADYHQTLVAKTEERTELTFCLWSAGHLDEILRDA